MKLEKSFWKEKNYKWPIIWLIRAKTLRKYMNEVILRQIDPIVKIHYSQEFVLDTTI